MFGGGELAFDPARCRRVGAGKRTEELTFDEGLRQRGAVDVDEGLPGAGATVVDDARHLALHRPRLAGEKDSDIERRQERRLAENGDKRGAATDQAFEPQALAQPAHVAVSVRRRSALEQLVGERREVTGEDLGAAAILLREGVPGLAALEIDDAAWNVVTDGRAEHRLDPASQHAVTGLEARIEQGRRRHDGSPGGERHGDDPTGNRRPHFRNRIRRESVGDPPARLRAAAVGTVQLEVALAGPDDLDDQAERLLEQRLARRPPRHALLFLSRRTASSSPGRETFLPILSGLVTSYNATFGTLEQYLAASSSQTPGPEATGGSPRTGV